MSAEKPASAVDVAFRTDPWKFHHAWLADERRQHPDRSDAEHDAEWRKMLLASGIDDAVAAASEAAARTKGRR